MKIRNVLFNITTFAAVLSLNVGLFINLKQKAVEVDAYDIGDCPTTIDLNDCSEQEIRNYYSGLNSLNSSERQGTNLLKNLKPILSNNQQYFSYDSNKKIWQMYEIIDRDWAKSPASSITYGTYNSSTNKITNYVYGTGNSDGKNNPYVHALYNNRELDNQAKAWGNHNQDGWGINQEHVWAKSHGFDTKGSNSTGGARGDPMHLWAGNGWANNVHSNNFYGFVDTTRSYIDAGTKYKTAYGNLSGFSKTKGGSETVFEPQDCDKGDIARAIFYMAARYNNYAGATSGIDGNNPNLVLLNDLSENSRTGTSGANNPYGMGILSDLLAWNKLDPVDEYEVHRNNLLYRNYTKNRNPFIDFPEWADAIWGTANLDGTNYNSTVTAYASPASDHIGSSISNTFDVSVKALNLHVNQEAEIYGKNANGTVTWSIENGSVASLNKTSSTGNEKVTVTALASGTTTITATCGSDTATCNITVSDATSIYGSLENPLTISEAIQVIDNAGGSLTAEKMYVRGTATSSSYSSTHDNFNYVWLQSDDGQTPQAFELYHTNLDESVQGDFTADDALKDYEVVAYGYGKKHNSTYELSPLDDSSEKPVILSAETTVHEKTPGELVEELTTSTMLSYRFTKQDGEASVTDTLDRAFTGRTGTEYGDWTNSGTSGVSYAGQSAGGNSSIQLRSKNSNSGIVVTANASMNATSISVVWNSNTGADATLDVYGKGTAYSLPSDLYGNNSGTKLGSIVCGTSTSLTINGDYKFIGLRSKSGAIWLESIEIEWGGTAATYSYSDVSIRFGGILTQELWNDLDTTNNIIEGFGVMIATDDVVDNSMQIKDFYDSAVLSELNPAVDEEIVDYYKPTTQMATPVSNDEDYYWNLFYRIAEVDFKTTYVASAYIKTSTDYFFFKQVRYSVKTLAADYIANRGCGPTTASGSLANLANL